MIQSIIDIYRKKTEKYELIAKSYNFIPIRGGSYMSLVKNAVDPTKGDLDKFEIRRRIRSYFKNKPYLSFYFVDYLQVVPELGSWILLARATIKGFSAA